MWLNPPPQVLQMRTQLMACACLTTPPFNLAQSQYHYPSLVPAVTAEQAAQGVTADTLPAILIAMTDSDRDTYAEGAQALFTGDLLVTVFADTVSCPDVGTLESLAENIVLQMKLQYFGLHFRRIRKGMSSDLEPGQVAAQVDTPSAGYYSQKIIFESGLVRGRT